MSWPVTLRFVNSLEYTLARIDEIARSFRLIRNTTIRKELKFEEKVQDMFTKNRGQSKNHHIFHKYDIVNTAVNVNICLDVVTIDLSENSLGTEIGPLNFKSDSTLSALELDCDLRDNLTCRDKHSKNVAILSLAGKDPEIRISAKTSLKVRNETDYDVSRM